MSATVEAFKKTFFDPRAVMDPAERVMKQKLSRYGAFVRQRAMSSLRTRTRAARPGEPPSMHVGLVKRLLFFGYEAEKQTVVIGPAKFQSKSPHTVPEILEYGGQTVIIRPRGSPRPANYREHPFMRPAEEAERENFMESLKDSITPGA